MRRMLVTALVPLLSLATTSYVDARPRAGDLTSERDEARWSGAAPFVIADERTVTVDLPDDVWALPGGVQFAVRWVNEADDLELRVTAPDGRVFVSDGIVSMAESVIVPNAPDGQYAVEVWSVSGTEVRYDGLAEVERPPAADPARPLLPDLVSLPARNVHLGLGAYYAAPAGPVTAASCYPEETAEQGARKCLRFDQVIANQGEGAFELRYVVPPESAQPSGDENLVTFEKLIQRVYWSDGRTPTDRFADRYEFHAVHAHFHYRQFAVSALWRADETGRRLGDAPAARGDKNGFCMVDVEMVEFGGRDTGRNYRPPACLAPTEGDENVNGISPGWADVYNWFLADQYIEVSHLTDGYYVLQTMSDPGETVSESNEVNNCSAVLVRLSAGVTRAEIVRPLAKC